MILKMITDTHSSLTAKPNTGTLHRQTLSISEVCRNKSVWKMFFLFCCAFLLSLCLVLLPLGSVAKASKISRRGEPSLEAAQDVIYCSRQ